MCGHGQNVILVGTSGWQYKDWSGRFYPDGLPQRLWLEHYAKSFATVEINNAFYRLPERATFESWRERTPSDFCVAVKMSRYLTHIKRLRDPDEPVARFLDRARGLGDRLGPVLLQLPPNLRGDADLLDAALRRFPEVGQGRRRAPAQDLVDRRDPRCPRTAQRGPDLGRPAQPPGRPALADGRLRLPAAARGPGPSPPPVRAGRPGSWVARLAEAYGDADCYVYFNNDPGGAAVLDATMFARIAQRHRLPPTRVPGQAVPSKP